GATLELRPRNSLAPVTVRVPAGADEGSRVRIAGHGATSVNGGPPGDLLLVIHVSPHRFFRREGADLHVDVPITLAGAYHGAKVKVPTIDGAVTVKVPPRTQTGAVLRVRGKGVAKKGKEPGDLYVRVVVHVPTSENPEVAHLVDELSKHQLEDPRHDLK